MDYMSEGFDVARKLRTNPATRSIPLIMLTGVDQLYNYRLEQDESWVPCDRYLEKTDRTARRYFPRWNP